MTISHFDDIVCQNIAIWMLGIQVGQEVDRWGHMDVKIVISKGLSGNEN